jgi:zinc protease
VAQAQAISLQISDALPTPPDAFLASATASPSALQTGHLELVQQQTHIVFAQTSVPRRHADHAALYAAGQILGGGSNNRLMNELRHKRGRVYDVYGANINWAGGAGLVTFTLQTGNSVSAGTAALVRDMLNEFLRDGPTTLELEHLKRRLANRNVLDSASNRQILARLVEINRYDLPLDLDYTVQQVLRLTVADVKNAMDRHLSADRWVSVTAGATVEQQPLPEPEAAPVSEADESMCRADTGFVAS